MLASALIAPVLCRPSLGPSIEAFETGEEYELKKEEPATITTATLINYYSDDYSTYSDLVRDTVKRPFRRPNQRQRRKNARRKNK
jgi:hypothetical protein